MWLVANPCGDTASESDPKPSRCVPVMVWRTGAGLSADASVSRARAHETVRPVRTVAAAAAVTSGVTRFSAPSSSSAPQRPQLESESKNPRTSAASNGWRGMSGPYRRTFTMLP